MKMVRSFLSGWTITLLIGHQHLRINNGIPTYAGSRLQRYETNLLVCDIDMKFCKITGFGMRTDYRASSAVTNCRRKTATLKLLQWNRPSSIDLLTLSTQLRSQQLISLGLSRMTPFYDRQ